jgi:hypothetical protein
VVESGSAPNPKTVGPIAPVRTGLPGVVAHLDSWIAVFERVFVLLICLALVVLILFFGWKSFHWHEATWTAAAKFLDDHWKAAIVVSSPLVLRPVLLFLERAQEAFGIKAPLNLHPIGATTISNGGQDPVSQPPKGHGS